MNIHGALGKERNGASTFNYLVFATSELKTNLEQPGFLLAPPGLTLFGDNAYSNTHYYMVTPFKGRVTGEDQDTYNYSQLQVGIQVKCLFGMLVHGWGILRRPLSQAFGTKKAVIL